MPTSTDTGPSERRTGLNPEEQVTLAVSLAVAKSSLYVSAVEHLSRQLASAGEQIVGRSGLTKEDIFRGPFDGGLRESTIPGLSFNIRTVLAGGEISLPANVVRALKAAKEALENQSAYGDLEAEGGKTISSSLRWRGEAATRFGKLAKRWEQLFATGTPAAKQLSDIKEWLTVQKDFLSARSGSDKRDSDPFRDLRTPSPLPHSL